MLFAHLLRRLITVGTLRVVDAGGKVHVFGETGGETVGESDGGGVTIRLHDRALHRQLFFNSRLGIGEAYMDGTLTIEEGTLYDFLDLCGVNLQNSPRYPTIDLIMRMERHLRRFQQYNPLGRAQRNIAHHYDLSGSLYQMFLDADRQYSCAYFLDPNDSLEQAQDNKKRHIAAKLLLEPGVRVLDIGSGWGGLALYLAQASNAEVTGITLSTEQQKAAEARAADAGLSNRVRFHLRDYREEKGVYDRIVSVGMFEHVGTAYYGAFFERIRDLLTEGGVALLHSIGRSDGPAGTNPWLRKYIFPGGYIPSLSEVLPAVERAGLLVTDIEILRLHYAETLRRWSERFSAGRDTVKALYDERFCRMWEFYLAGCEVAFRRQKHMVFQMQLTREIDAVPQTRDYMIDWERAHASGASLAA